MAKGNMLQGQATGKVGDIVFMVRNGQQVARVYTSAGGRSGDQASIAVRRQRVRFGAASNQYLLYRNIVRGMYRTGKSTKQSDYNFFVRENVDLLPYLTREENAAGVKCVMPGTFSRGTLGSLVFKLSYANVGVGNTQYSVRSSSHAITTALDWNDKVGDLKDALKLAFPNARKITYLLGIILPAQSTTPQGTVYSQSLSRGDVVFDLYEEDTNVGDDQTIAAYFEYYKPASLPANILSALESNFCDADYLFTLDLATEAASALFPFIYCLVFATNDQVGDCYTTTLSEIDVPSDAGGLSLYSTLRTDDHRQVAEDSYGYATGVMRTNIQQA